MLKLRLAVTAAFLVLLAGCPTEADDLRRARGEAAEPLSPFAGDSAKAEASASEYACTNLRQWREDLDLPQYLKEQLSNADDDAKRARLQKDYIRDHQGTLVVCHNKLKTEGNRGVCDVCTEMLKNDKYELQRTAPNEGGGANPIQLRDDQKLVSKIEFRLKFDKADYETDAAAQEKSFRDWLATRNAEQSYIDKAVELEKAKGAWTKDPAVPKLVSKYGLPPLAEPFVTCPNPACKTRNTVSAGILDSRCWNCNTYFTVTSRDEHLTDAEPLELLCPHCKAPIDPTINYCLKCNKFNRSAEREGVCWRCGGTRLCPECQGSGKGTAPIFNGGDACWLCALKPTDPIGTGICPECDGRGFTSYDGALPASFTAAKRSPDDWKLSKNAPAAAAKKEDGE